MKSLKLKKFQAGGMTTMSDDMQCPEASMNPQLDVENREEATNNPEIAYAVNAGTQDMGCANCALFDISKRMAECTQDMSDNTGYCWAHSFKCDSAAVCKQYEPGGPVIDDQVSYELGKDNAEGPPPPVDPSQQIAPDPAMQQGMAPPGMPPMEQPQMQMGPAPQMPMMRYGGSLPTFQGVDKSEVKEEDAGDDEVAKMWMQKLMESKMQQNPGAEKAFYRQKYPNARGYREKYPAWDSPNNSYGDFNPTLMASGLGMWNLFPMVAGLWNDSVANFVDPEKKSVKQQARLDRINERRQSKGLHKKTNLGFTPFDGIDGNYLPNQLKMKQSEMDKATAGMTEEQKNEYMKEQYLQNSYISHHPKKGWGVTKTLKPGYMPKSTKRVPQISFKDWIELQNDPKNKAVFDFINSGGTKKTVKTTEETTTGGGCTDLNGNPVPCGGGTSNSEIEIDKLENSDAITAGMNEGRLGGSHMYYSGGDLPKAQGLATSEMPPVGSIEWYEMQNQTGKGAMEAPSQFGSPQVGTMDWHKAQTAEFQTMQDAQVEDAKKNMAGNLNQFGQGNPLLTQGQKWIDQDKEEAEADAAGTNTNQGNIDGSGPGAMKQSSTQTNTTAVSEKATGEGVSDDSEFSFDPGAKIGSTLGKTGTEEGLMLQEESKKAQDDARRDEIIEKAFSGDKDKKGGLGGFITGALSKGVGIAAILNKGFAERDAKDKVEHYKTRLSADELANSGVFPTMTANRSETKTGHHTNTGAYGVGYKTTSYEDAFVPDYSYAAHGGETLNKRIYGGPVDIDDQLLNELIAAGADIERL